MSMSKCRDTTWGQVYYHLPWFVRWMSKPKSRRIHVSQATTSTRGLHLGSELSVHLPRLSSISFAVYSVANTLPETYNRVTPRIKKITSTQFSIAVELTDLTVKTKAMYKIDVHIQGISQSTEWFQTITKLRDPHFHGALILASLGSSN